MVGVAAVIFRGDHILIARRGRQPAYGLWSLPGGLVELGETLHEAVRREIREEVSLDIEVVDVIKVLDRIIPDAHGQVEYHYILIDFLCHCETGEPLPGSDVLDCRFVAVSDLPQYPLTSGTLAVIHKAIGLAENSSPRIYDRDL
jgi:8-oxo-dGTP diphosphatase